jgi:hypothetical protein
VQPQDRALREGGGDVGDQLRTTIGLAVYVTKDEVGGSDSERIDVVIEYAAECMFRCGVQIERAMHAAFGKLKVRTAGNETPTSARSRSFEQLAAEGDIGLDERLDVVAAMFPAGQGSQVKDRIRSGAPECLDDSFSSSIDPMQVDGRPQSALQFVSALAREAVDFHAGAVQLVRKFLTHKPADSADERSPHEVCSPKH